MHCMYNAAAQHALLRGSSSIYSGDHLVGLTWELAADLDCWPYFDRVRTKSNPIDGVTRRNYEGPWRFVTRAVVPLQMIRQLAAECSEFRLSPRGRSVLNRQTMCTPRYWYEW